MSAPTIGVYIPTQGRESLLRTLQSITQQRLIPGDEVLVMGDGPVPAAKALCESLGPPFRYLETEQTNDWGHSQNNIAVNGGMKPDLLLAQDDDDIYLPRAFESIRQLAADFPNRLLGAHVLGRVGLTPSNGTIGNWDGHCLIVPNDYTRTGYWAPEYEGDQFFCWSTSKLWEGAAAFGTPIISAIRPKWRLWYWEVRTLDQVQTLRELRNGCREFMTHRTNEISPARQQEWWRGLDHKNTWAFLFTNGEDGEYIGFSLLRRRDGKMYTTYGLKKDYRGQGLGKELVELTMYACQGGAFCDMRQDNAVMRAIHKKLGWVETSQNGTLIEAQYEWPAKVS